MAKTWSRKQHNNTRQLVVARHRMERRLAAGESPSPGDLQTLWESYQAAVFEGRVSGQQRLPDDLVADMKADHDSLVRELQTRMPSSPHNSPNDSLNNSLNSTPCDSPSKVASSD